MEITLATWNVQTMLKPGRMKEIMEEISKVRVDAVAVHEIRWRRIGCPKRSSLKNWKGREEGEDPGKDGKWK